MLLTARTAIVDLRPLSVSESIRTGIRLPPTWTEDSEFVRGVGRVRRRPLLPTAEWRHERVYCDYSRTVRFEQGAVEKLNRAQPGIRTLCLKRRMYTGHAPECTFDFDVLAPGLPRMQRYLELSDVLNYTAQVLRMPVAIGRTSALPARWDRAANVELYRAGRDIAQRFGTSTATSESRAIAVQLVRCNWAPVVTIELEGIRPYNNMPGSSNIHVIGGGVEILSTKLRASSGYRSDVQVYILSSKARGKQSRAVLRELRIHLLRLTTLRRLLQCILLECSREHPAILLERSRPFDQLQQAINTCVDAMRSTKFAVAPKVSLLSAAFFADSIFSSYELHTLLDRISDARPNLLRKIEAFGDADEVRVRSDRISE